jgi:hypothetical protein
MPVRVHRRRGGLHRRRHRCAQGVPPVQQLIVVAGEGGRMYVLHAAFIAFNDFGQS